MESQQPIWIAMVCAGTNALDDPTDHNHRLIVFIVDVRTSVRKSIDDMDVRFGDCSLLHVIGDLFCKALTIEMCRVDAN